MCTMSSFVMSSQGRLVKPDARCNETKWNKTLYLHHHPFFLPVITADWFSFSFFFPLECWPSWRLKSFNYSPLFPVSGVNSRFKCCHYCCIQLYHWLFRWWSGKCVCSRSACWWEQHGGSGSALYPCDDKKLLQCFVTVCCHNTFPKLCSYDPQIKMCRTLNF